MIPITPIITWEGIRRNGEEHQGQVGPDQMEQRLLVKRSALFAKVAAFAQFAGEVEGLIFQTIPVQVVPMCTAKAAMAMDFAMNVAGRVMYYHNKNV